LIKRENVPRILILTLLLWVASCGSGGDPNLCERKLIECFYTEGWVSSIALANDASGDVYVGGEFLEYNVNVEGNYPEYNTTYSNIIRLNSDGTVDPGFDNGSGIRGIISNIVTARDGSGDVYIQGDFSKYNGNAVNKDIIRLNSDGTVDAGFDTDEFDTDKTAYSRHIISIALANDGSGDVYIGGSFTGYDDNVVKGIIRLNSDGTVDAGFDTDENAFANYTGTNWSSINRIAVATDGSGDVYAAGWLSKRSETKNIIRLNSDGTVDAGFNSESTIENVFGLVVATDGSGDVHVGGYNSVDDGSAVVDIIRLNSDGTVDAGFDTGSGLPGKLSVPSALAIDGSGDVYVGGDFSDSNGYNVIVRLNSDGTIDASFDTAVSVYGHRNEVRSINLATDGSGDVYAAGFFPKSNDYGPNDWEYDGNGADELIRLNSDGTVDAGFDTGSGFVRVNYFDYSE